MNKGKEVLIITGGTVDYSWAHEWLKNKKFDFVIAADSGLVHAHQLEIAVNYILGDYDSVDQKILEEYKKNVQIVTYPREKNYTDTHIAIMKAMECGATSISILGATGSRYDHAMTNIYNIKLALDKHIRCAIYDPNNKIYLANESFIIMQNQQYGNFLSFVPMSEEVVISLNGVKYPLDRYELKQGVSICQSNEIIMDKAEVILEKGSVVVFETKD